MISNKAEFKKIIQYTILNKHRHKMGGLKHYHRTRVVGLDNNKPVEEYGIHWDGGDIGVRVYLNDNSFDVWAKIGKEYDCYTFDFYDNDEYIINNKQLIKEMIKGVEGSFILNSNYEI